MFSTNEGWFFPRAYFWCLWGNSGTVISMVLSTTIPASQSPLVRVAEERSASEVRTVLEERPPRPSATAHKPDRGRRLRRFLEQEAWPQVPDELRGASISKAERESILGYGPEGV
jgi:antitoxin VapB